MYQNQDVQASTGIACLPAVYSFGELKMDKAYQRRLVKAVSVAAGLLEYQNNEYLIDRLLRQIFTMLKNSYSLFL